MIAKFSPLNKINLATFSLVFFASSLVFAKKIVDLSNFPAAISSEITKEFPQIKNNPVGLDIVDNIIRRLQTNNDFDRIQVFEEDGKYKISYLRAKRIGNVQFFGVKFFSKSEAENYITLKSADTFDQQDLVEQAERLRQSYKEKGFVNTIIDIEMPPNIKNKDDIDIHIKVTENKRSLIHKINIQSSNAELNKSLTSHLDSKIDEPLTDKTLADINKKIRSYFTDEGFVHAEIIDPTINYNNDQSQATLNFKIEKSENYVFDFQGLQLLRTRDLKMALDLDNYYSTNPNVGAELAQKIRTYCVSEGYAHADVNFEEKDLNSPFNKLITFKIEEGPRIRLENIIVNGGLSRKTRYYTDFIKEHSSAVVADGYFNKEDLDTGLHNLTLQLQNEGYLQVKVFSTRIQYNREKTKVTMYVNMDEGPLTLIKSIDFNGNLAYSNDALLRITDIKPGPLKLHQIESAVTNIKNYYHDHGYIEMQLLNEKEDLVTYDETSTQALLNFKILEGPQVRTASIIIEGNNFTKNYVILNELELHPGELITPQKIENSVNHLQRSGLFNTVEVRTLEEKTNVENRTVLVKVSERDPGLFTIGIGATNERKFTLRGYTGIAYRNLLGTGRGISLRLEGNYNVAEYKYFENKLVVGYLEPYLFNSRMRGRANITRSSQITNYSVKQVTDINSYSYSFEKDFSNHILGTWDVLSLAQVKDSGVDSTYPYAPESQEIATTGPNIDIDYRDNPFNPTKGHFTRINTEYSDPMIGSSDTIKYWKAMASFSHYLQVATWIKQPVVWANQIRGAYMKNLSELSVANNGVPWDKKGFSLGGTSTVRGYEAGTEYFPNNKDLGIEGANVKYYLGTEASMFLIKSELRFPIQGSLGGAVFYDGGQVLIDGVNIKDPYRSSTGFGIRYNTPVGALSVDLAWKLNMQSGESPLRVHVSIGNY